MLIVKHDGIESHETVNVLNYFSFPMKVEVEDYWGSSARDFEFSKTDEYPLLYVESSSEEMPPCSLSGKDSILAFLFNNKLIGNYKSYGVYEKQGLALVEETVEPAVDALFQDWRTLAQYHMKPKHFRQEKMSIEGTDNVRVYLYKIVAFFRDLKHYRKLTDLGREERYEQV